jgi:tetratricopeptide (TPR) repeat protein
MIDQKRKESEERIAEDPNSSVEIVRLEHRAEIERQRGDYDKAIATLSELMTLRIVRTENLKAVNLDTSTEIEATVKLLQTFGAVFAESGDTERSLRAYKDASRLQRKHTPSKPPTEKNS